MAFYCCPYILRTGEVCNRGCYRPAGCQVHWSSPKRVPCKECGKLTFSKYGACDILCKCMVEKWHLDKSAVNEQ